MYINIIRIIISDDEVIYHPYREPCYLIIYYFMSQYEHGKFIVLLLLLLF